MKVDKFHNGDWVQSIPVNRKGAFVGEIVDKFGPDYVVRDSENRKWIRSAFELTKA